MCTNTCTYDSSYAQLYAALVANRPPSMQWVYFMQGKDVFRVIPGVFGITLANRRIFGIGIFTVLGR